MPELDTLILIRDRYAVRKHPMARLFTRVIDAINRGHSLDAAFYPWIPQEETMLLRGGVQGNRLPEALMDCVMLIQARQKIMGGVVAAVAYPALLLSLFLVLLLTVALYVVPELALISDPERWTGPAAVLYSVSAFIASPAGAVLFLVVFCAVLAALVSLPYWTGSLRARFDNAPPWSIYRLLVGSVWLFTVATLLRSNIQLETILTDMLGADTARPWLKERIGRIKEGYRIEGNFGKLLLSLKLNFPDAELVEDLAVYARMPDFHNTMYAVAKEWLDEGVERIGAQAKILNTGLLVGIMAVLCGLGVAIGSMQQQLTNSMGGL
jgi:type II secretory pathway component PulF